MTRAERRRAEREAKKQPQEMIQLVNPVAEHFAEFIFANSLKCDKVVEQGSAEGQHIVICGAGPSLADDADDYCNDADQLWGCNSALIWLLDQGYPVTHGLTIDQTAHMVEEWYSAPDVEYLVASSCHPHLIDWLLKRGRDLRFFHNFVGVDGKPVGYAVCQECSTMMEFEIEPCPRCGGADIMRGHLSYEDWMYQALYLATVRVGAGLNSVSRAIEVAMFTGAGKVTVLGADCALRIKSRPPLVPRLSPEHIRWLKDDAIMHADGSDPLRSGATSTTIGAEIRGRYWETKPDMAITAKFLVDMAHHFGDRLELVGDTLPNWIMDEPEEFLSRLPGIFDHEGKEVRYKPGSLAEIDNVAPLTGLEAIALNPETSLASATVHYERKP